MKAIFVADLLKNLKEFEDTLQGIEDIQNALTTHFAIIKTEDFDKLEFPHYCQAIANATKRRLDWSYFPQIERFLMELPLIQEVEPVVVGFGVVVTPSNIQKALLVVGNATLLLTKQTLLTLIVKTIQAKDFAQLDPEFFLNYLTITLETFIQKLSFTDIDVKQYLIQPIISKLQHLVVTEQLDPSILGVADFDFQVLRAIFEAVSTLENEKEDDKHKMKAIEKCLGFLKYFDLQGSSVLNYELFALASGLQEKKGD